LTTRLLRSTPRQSCRLNSRRLIVLGGCGPVALQLGISRLPTSGWFPMLFLDAEPIKPVDDPL